MDNNYKGMAVGVFELDNLVACFVALDAAPKQPMSGSKVLSVTV